MKPALIIGSTCVDIILRMDHLPKTAENLRPTAQSMALGGCAYNVSHMFRLLRVPHTFITPVGGGVYGDYVKKQLETQDIPVEIHLPDQENGCCYCLVEANGERTFLSCHGVEYSFQKSWMERYKASDYGLVYVCGLEIEEPTGIALIEYLEEHPQLSLCYAPGPRGILIPKERTRRLLRLHPILHVNEQEAYQLSGAKRVQEAARLLHALTNNTVIITLGSRGAYCLEKDQTSYVVPSMPCSIADTIGAGDSHIGTILACLTKDIPLYEAIAYANQVAAAVVQVDGASLPASRLPKPPFSSN